MSLLTKILEKLGLKKPEDSAATGTAGASGKAGSAGSGVGVGARPDFNRTPAMGHPISEVDVVAKLEKMAAGSPGLDWKVSIVDLLKLLDIDSSKEARTELAKELGCPPDLMSDSAKMNVWLHKEVLRRIAQNGGNVPANMLD